MIVRRDESLARHTAWRTGGPCDAFVLVRTVAEYFEAVEWCRSENLPMTLLGAGSRSAARDGGLSGAVIRLVGEFCGWSPDNDVWKIGAAAPMPAVVASAVERGFGGLEDLATHPGSFGAALALDDGPGAGWGTVVESVRYAFRGREKHTDYSEFSAIKGRPTVFGATLRLRSAAVPELRERVLARWRGQSRQVAVPPSSWVYPPKKASLREVLDRGGLRDIRLRDVSIPAAAPEMLVNLGGGTARDLALLHQSALERVARECGVELQSRITWLGRV